jgi:hypothetical protein
MAIRYADAVGGRLHGTELEGALGNVRGVLGEIMAVAALNYLTTDQYFHVLSNIDEDRKGIDLNAFEYRCNDGHSILGLGVKLGKNCSSRIVRKKPLVNFRVDKETFEIDGLIEQQSHGKLVSPRKYVEYVFEQPNNRIAFQCVLFKQFNTAVNNKVIKPDTFASDYAQQFINN